MTVSVCSVCCCFCVRNEILFVKFSKAVLDDDTVPKTVLTEEQEEKLYEHLENTEGSANVENTVREFAEIIHNAGDALKNL